MAPAIPLVAAVAGSGVTAALGGGLLGALGGFVVSTAINQLGSRLFAKKPKTSSFGADASGRIVQVRSSVESHKIIYGQARVSGPLAYVATANDGAGPASPAKDNKMLYMVIPLAGHEVEEIGDVYFNDQVVTLDAGGYVVSAPYFTTGSYAIVRKHLGSPDQLADPLFAAEAPGWSVNHRLRGIAYLAIRLEYNADVFPLGIPNVSAVVKGKKVYDPRTALTAWTDNAALCIRDYLSEDYGFGCDADEINDAYFIAAANTCDESVALSTGGTQARYTCNGVVDTEAVPLDNLGQLVSSLAGAVTYVQGAFRLHAGAYDTPSADIPTSMLAGSVKLRARTPRKELFNGVKGTYVDPAKSWQPTDFPAVTNAAYEAQDNGEQIFKDVELPFTTHPERAQRVAKVLLEKARQGLVVEMPVNHTGLRLAVFDVVTLTNDQLGWDAKPFRLLKWAFAAPTGNSAGGIMLTLQEESSAAYDWNSGEATTTDPAPDTSLPDPFDVSPPGTPQVTEALYVTTDGSGVKSKAVVTWEPSPDAFARDYQLEYKLASATAYTVAGRTFGTTLEILDIAPGTYDFRVKVYNNLGVSSAYANTTAEIQGLTAPPSDISNFSLNAIHNNAHVTWDQVPDIDVRTGGYVRIRHTPELASPSWSSAIDIGPALPGIATQAVLPLLDGTYMAKAVDSTGTESVTAALIISTVANIVKMNRVITREESPDFPDIENAFGFEVIDGALQLSGSGLFNSHAGNFDDAQGLFDGGGGFTGTGVYDFGFDNSIDMGKVTTARVSANISAEVYDPTATFDETPGNFDDRTGLFDGDDLTGIDVKLYVYTSDDGVAWSDPRQFYVGDYTCRYLAFRLLVEAENDPSSINIRISELGVTVDVPDVTDSGSLTTSAGGVTTVTFAKTFYADPDVGMTIQSATVGDQEIVQNVTDQDFEIAVKDAGGSFVARTVAWHANGF